MKLTIEGTKEEIKELLQAIDSSKEQKISVSTPEDSDGNIYCGKSVANY